MLSRDGVYDNIRAWDLGDEKLDVISLVEEGARRFGKDGPISTLARCLLALDEAEAEADRLREEINSVQSA